MDDYSALAHRVAGAVADVRGCLILSRDGLVLGSYPEDDGVVKPAWLRFSALGDPERSFVEHSDQVWAYVRRGPFAAFAIAAAGVRPGLLVDQLEQMLLAAEEARVKRDGIRVPDAPAAPSGRPRTSLHPAGDAPATSDVRAGSPAGTAERSETRPWARGRVAAPDDGVGPTPARTATADAPASPSGGSAAKASDRPGAEEESAATRLELPTPSRDRSKKVKSPQTEDATPTAAEDPAAADPDGEKPDGEADGEADIVDPVLLAKEFSGLLQVQEGGDEGSS